MTARGCFLCLSGFSDTQLRLILTEQGQGGTAGRDVSHQAGALVVFDISCFGIHSIHLSYCALLENVFTQAFWHRAIMGRMNEFELECYSAIATLC